MNIILHNNYTSVQYQIIISNSLQHKDPEICYKIPMIIEHTFKPLDNGFSNIY